MKIREFRRGKKTMESHFPKWNLICKLKQTWKMLNTSIFEGKRYFRSLQILSLLAMICVAASLLASVFLFRQGSIVFGIASLLYYGGISPEYLVPAAK